MPALAGIDVEQYTESGYALVRQVLTEDELRALRLECDACPK
jgi:hypothetical protein